MAYNLPPPWDPGFALPDNVRDEGLARHAYVTAMQPRGSFDNPKVGTGGYAVPKYVLDEGLGRGTYTTKMAPRGSYAGPRVPSWLNRRPAQSSNVWGARSFVPPSAQVAATSPIAQTLSGLLGLGGDDADAFGGGELPEPYKSFGDRAAQVMLAGARALPATHQASHLKAMADHLDKSLWSRVTAIHQRYRAQGLPPQQAFPAALARGLGTGLLAETLAYGTGAKTLKKRPAARTMIGMGCYGPCSLGDTAPVSGSTSILKSLLTSSAAKSILGQCSPPPGWTWDAGSQMYAESVWWQTPIAAPGCPDPATVPFRPGSQSDPKAYFLIKQSDGSMPPMRIRAHSPTEAWKITGTNYQGGAQAGQPNITIPAASISKDAKAWFKKVLTSGDGDFYPMSSIPDKVKRKRPGPLPEQSPVWNAQLAAILRPFGITPGTSINWSRLTGENAIARAKHPTSGGDYILRLVLDRVAPTNKDDSNLPSGNDGGSSPASQGGALGPANQRMIHSDVVANPLALWVEWIPRPTSFLEDVWNDLTWLATEFVAVIAATLGAIGDLVCATMSAPNAGAGAAIGGAAVGVPPQAAAGGANLAKQACSKPMPYLPPPDSGWGLPLLVAGGVAAIALLASRKKEA